MSLNSEYQSRQPNLPTQLRVNVSLLYSFVQSKMNPLNIFSLPQHNITASWEAPPSHRGTCNIFYSCCITLLLCVWKVIHLSIPQKRGHGQAGGRPKTPQTARQTAERWLFKIRDTIVDGVRDLRRPGTLSYQVKWAIFAAFAPEMVVCHAVKEWERVRRFYNDINKEDDVEHGQPSCEAAEAGIENDKRVRKLDEQSDEEFSQQAGMDGHWNVVSAPVKTGECLGTMTKKKSTKVHESSLPSDPSTPTDTESGRNERKSSDQRSGSWTMTHSFYAHMGGFEFINATGGTMTSKRFKEGCIVSPEGLLSLKREKRIHSPPVDRKDIEDKSKVSYATKAFILFQALYFCVQCVSRVCEGLPTSLLEVSTFAHCVVALLVECFWFRKPLSIQLPSQTLVPQSTYDDAEKYLNDPREKIDGLADCSAIGFCSLLYGGLHLLAWNVSFPSQAEKLLWRIAAVTVTLTGPQIAICYIWCDRFLWSWLCSEPYKHFHSLLRSKPDQRKAALMSNLLKSLSKLRGKARFYAFCAFCTFCFSCLVLLLQAFVRVFLLVECFIHLAYLPEAAYQVVEWSRYFPHIS